MHLLSLLSLLDAKLPQAHSSESLAASATVPEGVASPFAGLLAQIGAESVDSPTPQLPLTTAPAQTSATKVPWRAADATAPELEDSAADGAQLPPPAFETGDSLPDQPPAAAAVPMPTSLPADSDAGDDGATPAPSVGAGGKVAPPTPVASDRMDSEPSRTPRPVMHATPSDPDVRVVLPMGEDRDGVLEAVDTATAASSGDAAVRSAGSAGVDLPARESMPSAVGAPGRVARTAEQHHRVEASPLHRALAAGAMSAPAATDATNTTGGARSTIADAELPPDRRQGANEVLVDPLPRRAIHLSPPVNAAPSKAVEASALAYPVNDHRAPSPVADAIRERGAMALPVQPEPAPAGSPITTATNPPGLPPQFQIRHSTSTPARTSEREFRLELRSFDGQRNPGDAIDPSLAPMPARGRSAAEMPPVDARLWTGAATPDASSDTRSEPSLPKTDAALPRPADPPPAAVRPQPQPLQFVPNQLMRFGAELTDRVIQLRAYSLDRATIALDPADLGRVEIRLRMDAETTHVGFVAHNASVRDAIEAQLPRLRALLESSGLTLGDVDVDQSDTPGDGGRSPSEETPRRTSRPRIDAVAAEDLRPSLRDGPRADGALIDVHA